LPVGYGNPWAQTYQPFGNIGGIGLGYPQFTGGFAGFGGQPFWSINPLAAWSQSGLQGPYAGMPSSVLGGFGQFPPGIRGINPLEPYGAVTLGNQAQFTPTPRFSFA
jgi:hypothetical protein